MNSGSEPTELARRLSDTASLTARVRAAVRDAVLRHRQNENPMAAWESGQVILFEAIPRGVRNMSEAFYTATTDDAKSWLDGGDEFLPPESILNDLTEDQVRTAPAGCPYSIAQIVAHMHYWQGGSLAKLRGQEWKRPAHLEDTFAPPAAGTWESLRTAFLADLNTIRALADTQQEYGYVSRALHNGYHLGQIVLLRRIQGLWPPAGGEAYDF